MIRPANESYDVETVDLRVSDEVFARRMELVRSLAGTLSQEEADRLEALLDEAFERVDERDTPTL